MMFPRWLHVCALVLSDVLLSFVSLVCAHWPRCVAVVSGVRIGVCCLGLCFSLCEDSFDLFERVVIELHDESLPQNHAATHVVHGLRRLRLQTQEPRRHLVLVGTHLHATHARKQTRQRQTPRTLMRTPERKPQTAAADAHIRLLLCG